MKKKRILMLFVSLFAITPAVLGSAWGVENRGKLGAKQECEWRRAKNVKERIAEQAVSGVSKSGKKTSQQSVD